MNTIKGIVQSHIITIDDIELDPTELLHLSEFSWGRTEEANKTLALAIMKAYTGDPYVSLSSYLNFYKSFLFNLKEVDFSIEIDLKNWISRSLPEDCI